MSSRRTPQKLFPSLLAALLVSGLAGCTQFQAVCTNKWLDVAWVDPGSSQKVHDVLSYWHNQIVVTQDPVRSLAPLPGLAGRVMLFNEETGQSLDAQGKVIVMMYDVPAAKGGQPKQLGKWTFPAESLKRLKRKDRISDGYTLFLPWEDYRPEIKQVHLQVCYVPEKGEPHWGAVAFVTLQSEPVQVTSSQHQFVPAGTPPPAKQ